MEFPNLGEHLWTKVGHNLHPDIITVRDEITRKVKWFDNFIPNAFPYDRWY